MMPEMDGYTLCAKIKTNINVNFIPVVLLTAKSHEKDKIEGLSTGADSYIEKPFNIKVLEYTIRNLIASYDILRNKVEGKEMPEENMMWSYPNQPMTSSWSAYCRLSMGISAILT